MTRSYDDLYWNSSDGLRLHARDHQPAAGTSPRGTVVCIPGLTRNGADFDALATTLSARGWRVLAVDLRGRAGSARAPDPSSYNPRTYADDLVALLRAQGIDRSVFIGTSLGVLVTITLATRAPGLIAAAVLNDAGPEVPAEALARMMDRHRYTQEQLGQVVGKSQAAVSQVLGLLNLPETIRAEYRAAPRSSKSLLVEIAAMKSEAEQLRLWAAIKDGRIANVKAARTERAAQKQGESPPFSTLEVIKACKRLKIALDRLEAPVATRIPLDAYNALVTFCERLHAIVAGMTPEPPDVETDDTDYES